MSIPSPVTLGPCTLYLGDCAEIADVAGPVDLVLIDPPYGIGESSKNHASRNKLAASPDYGYSNWDDEAPSVARITALCSGAKKAIVWGGNHFGLPIPASKWLVWEKLNGDNDFADCELAWTNLEGAVRRFTHRWAGMLRDSERDTPRVHPTQKPVALMSWCINQAKLEPDSLVADYYMGSGTTGIACIRAGMRFVGCERDPKHFQTACDRIRRELQQQRLPL